MTISTIDILAILGVILFGIPHGALDWELVKHSDSQPKLMRFLCFYLGFTAFGLFLWIMLPTATLLFFLLITAGHFGRADPFRLSVVDVHNNFLKTANILFQGGAISVFLPWVHWSTVEPLFTALNANTVAIAAYGFPAVSLWLLSFVCTVCFGTSLKKVGVLFGFAAYYALHNFLNPLLTFSLFFCLLHSTPHYLKASEHIGTPATKPNKSFWVNTVCAWVLVILAFAFFDNLADAIAPLLSAVFAILFALTLPHMIIVDILLPKRFFSWRITAQSSSPT